MFNLDKDWTLFPSREAPIFLVRGSLLKAMMSQSHDKKRQRTLGEAWRNSEKKSREAASVWGLRSSMRL